MKTGWEQLEMCWAVQPNIRGGRANDYLIAGIEVGEQEHRALFGTASGEPLPEPLVFGNHRFGFEQLIARADELEVELDLSRVVFGVKPIAGYHKPLVEYLIDHEEITVLVPTVAGRAERGAAGGDPGATLAAVAQRVAQGQWAAAPEPQLEGLRQLVRTRVQLEQQAQGVAKRMRQQLMAQYFPELEAAAGARHRAAPDRVVLQLMRSCFDPAASARKSFAELWHQVAEPSWGAREQARLVAVWQAAAGSIGCAQSVAVAWEAQRLAEQWESVQRQLTELDQLTCELVRWWPGYASVLTIPGVGPRGAAMIVAELGEPHRFTHRQQVLRWAGLDLRPQRSGRARISRRGNAALRAALVHAAQVAVHCHPPIRAWFAKGLEGREPERGLRRKREVHLAAKLLVVAWRLMQRGGSFDPKKFAR
jgi:transposase